MLDTMMSLSTRWGTPDKTVSLLKLDGTDQMQSGTQIKDSANPSRIWTLNSGASVIAERQKFGTKSLKINGGFGLTTPHDASMFASTTGTVEMWVNIYDLTAWNLFFTKSATTGQSPFMRQYSNNRVLDISFDNGSGGSGTNSALFTVNLWAHIAITIDGSNKVFYLNGVAVRSDSLAAQTFGHLAYPISIGSNNRRGTNDIISKFYAQAMRISNVVRYPGNFTPPTTMFELD